MGTANKVSGKNQWNKSPEENESEEKKNLEEKSWFQYDFIQKVPGKKSFYVEKNQCKKVPGKKGLGKNLEIKTLEKSPNFLKSLEKRSLEIKS